MNSLLRARRAALFEAELRWNEAYERWVASSMAEEAKLKKELNDRQKEWNEAFIAKLAVENNLDIAV